MEEMNSKSNLRIAILQRVCAPYRVLLFQQLSTKAEIKLFIGEDMPNSKVKNTANLDTLNHQKLKTRFLRFGKRILPWHVGLVRKLKKFKPDVILCEAESHFIGYLQAIFYRIFYNRRVGLIYWCYIGLPGKIENPRSISSLIKKYFRKFFDAFLLYSSYSKDCLIKLGQSSNKIFVATNVGDTQQLIKLSDSIVDSAKEARAKLKLPERFTVLYTGTLDANKYPDKMLELAKLNNDNKYNFVLLGSGPMLEPLKEQVNKERLTNVFIPGRVADELPLYYRASDVLVIPGRGGIVISEVMAFSLPVIVHQADGTEYDLVQDNRTGFILKNNTIDEFNNALDVLYKNPDLKMQMGNKGKQLITNCFTTDNMIQQIIHAAQFAKKARTSKMTN